MAVTCANCGAQNPDGNAYCQNCGQPLAAPPPAAPGTGDTSQTVIAPLAGAQPPPAAGPPPGPPAYGGGAPAGGGYGAIPPGGAPPYQQFGGGMPPGMPPQHRLPVFAIVGAVIGAIILLALAAVVVHAVASKSSTTPTPIIAPPTPTSAVSPTPVTSPTTTGGTATPTAQTTQTGQTVTPTPAATTGGATPTPTANATSTGGTTVETNTWKATMPSGSWKVVNQKNASAELDDPNGNGFIYINAGTQSPAASTDQVIQAVISQITSQNQNAKECDNGRQQASIGNPPVVGTIFIYCYTVNNQNGQAVQVVDYFWIGTASGGTKLYDFEVFGPQSAFNALGTDVTSIIKSIQWKV
jgi:hypothetical protein